MAMWNRPWTAADGSSAVMPSQSLSRKARPSPSAPGLPSRRSTAGAAWPGSTGRIFCKVPATGSIVAEHGVGGLQREPHDKAHALCALAGDEVQPAARIAAPGRPFPRDDVGGNRRVLDRLGGALPERRDHSVGSVAQIKDIPMRVGIEQRRAPACAPNAARRRGRKCASSIHCAAWLSVPLAGRYSWRMASGCLSASGIGSSGGIGKAQVT